MSNRIEKTFLFESVIFLDPSNLPFVMAEVVSRKPRGPPIADVIAAWRQEGLQYRLEATGLPAHFIAELELQQKLTSCVDDSLPKQDVALEVRAEIDFRDIATANLYNSDSPLRPLPLQPGFFKF